MGNNLYIQNKKYDEFMTADGPVKFYDYVNDKHEIIHQELYNEAMHEMFDDLLKYEFIHCEYTTDEDVQDVQLFNENEIKDVKTYDDFIENNFITEIKENDYFKPSKVIICSKSFPYKKITVDLTPYWNDYQYITKYKDINDLFIDEDSVTDAEIIYVDHVNCMVKMKSRLTGKEFWVSSEYVNRDTTMNKEAMSRENTFVNMLYNY